MEQFIVYTYINIHTYIHTHTHTHTHALNNLGIYQQSLFFKLSSSCNMFKYNLSRCCYGRTSIALGSNHAAWHKHVPFHK